MFSPHGLRSVRLCMAMVCLWLAASARPIAQTNPCDQTPAVNPTLQTQSVWFGLCVPVKYDDGTFVQYTSFRVTVDGANVFNGVLSPKANPTATGWAYYETPLIPIARGSHTAVSYASDATSESPGSDPYTFTIKPGPKKGKIQVVGK